jgi:DNA-binding transcriptional LysR family regulator
MVISDILLFVRIAETLSFKEAAQHLGMSRAQVSKRIAALEKAVGARLIYRSPRSISLTAAGELLLGYYRQIFDTMEEAKVAVENLRSTCSGRLRFSMPTCIGATLLPRLYCEFMPRHPHLLLEAHTSESCVDIVAGGYDVAIRMAQRLDDSTLTARRLATSSLVLAAAPAYLQERGSPGHPAELTRHRCLGLHGAKHHGPVWTFVAAAKRLAVPVSFWAASDTHLALVDAASDGLGLIYVPMVTIASELRQGKLLAVLPEFCRGVECGIHAVHAGRTTARNVAAFIEFVRDTISTFDGVKERKLVLPHVPCEPPPEPGVLDRLAAGTLHLPCEL